MHFLTQLSPLTWTWDRNQRCGTDGSRAGHVDYDPLVAGIFTMREQCSAQGHADNM